MPVLLATLLVPALLTWALGSAFRLSEEDMMLVFVVLFLITFLVSVAGAHLFEHGQRFRRQKILEDMTTTQKLQWLLAQRPVAMAGVALLAATAWGGYRLMGTDSRTTPDAPPPERAASVQATPASHIASPSAAAPASDVRIATKAPALAASVTDAVVQNKAALELASAQQLVHTWVGAWAARDLDTYLATYGTEFVPADGLPRAKWEAQRRQRIGSAEGLSVKIMDLSVEPLGREKVQAVFIQKYQTSKLSDLSRKTLVLKKQGADWKIVSEQATPLKG